MNELFVDTISYTIKINKSAGNLVKSRLEQFVQTHIDIAEELEATYKSGYEKRFKLKAGGAYVQLFAVPRRDNQNFLRVEYSAKKIGEDGLIFLGDLFSQILRDDWLQLIQNASLTRVDLAVDLKRTPLASLVVRHARRNQMSSVYLSKKGNAETIYWPPNIKTRGLVVYDKIADKISKGDICPRKHHRLRAITRIEQRYKKVTGCKICEFVDQVQDKNPFNRYEFRIFLFSPTASDEDKLILHALKTISPSRLERQMTDVNLKNKVKGFYEGLPYAQFHHEREQVWAGLRHAFDNALPRSR